MSLVTALGDIKPEKVKRTNFGTSTSFFGGSPQTADGRTAYAKIVRHIPPGMVSSAHFHAVDQFQIIIDGKGKFGRHDVAPYCVHFSRANTPYGPLLPDVKAGWAFMTLRTRPDPGAQRFPEAKDKLKLIAERHPWQITRKVTFQTQGADISLHDIPGISDEQGLSAHSLTMLPGAHLIAPDPGRGDGQYVVVLRGSLVHENKECGAPTIVFVNPGEPAFAIHAGMRGLGALILNFPQVKQRALDAASDLIPAWSTRRQCLLCAFIYDETLGVPEDGIAAGTRWEDVPDAWTCPDCSAGKGDFEMV